MPLTNADYLANPQPASADLIAHFTTLGASRPRAERLAQFVRVTRVGRALIKPASLLGIVCAVWIAYAFWLAFNGSPSTPVFEQMLWPSIGALILGVVIAISRAVALTTGPFWEPDHVIPRELASAPRRAIVKPMPLAGVFAGIGLAFVVAIAGLIVPDVRNASWLRHDALETTGKVVSRAVRNGKSKRYTVTYRYASNGEVMQNSASVSRAEYERMTEGSAVPVTYYRLVPTISKPRSQRELGAFAPLLAMGGGMVGLVAFMTLLMSYAQRQTEAMATRGVAVLARMTKVDHRAAHYSYDTREGVIDARSPFRKQKPAQMPVEGETYIVLYDPDNPRRSMPLAILQDVQFS